MPTKELKQKSGKGISASMTKTPVITTKPRVSARIAQKTSTVKEDVPATKTSAKTTKKPTKVPSVAISKTSTPKKSPVKENITQQNTAVNSSVKKPLPKFKKLVKKPTVGSVVYIAHLPHGFYEKEMKQYFSQFGEISRIRLSRSKKTANSKGYAFIEFQDPDVAQIASEAMNNYLLFGKLLKCSVVSKDRLYPDLLKGANRRFKNIPWQQIARQQREKEKDSVSAEKAMKQLLSKESKKRSQLKSLGIDYDFPGYAALKK